jgi:2-desacetyl-2-hydroxyethyl bacteriochlorophyllide A dehydrogenase
MTTHARAFWVAAPGRGEIRSETLPEPGTGDVLVRTRWSGVSRGTESLVFSGRVPPSEFTRMRAPFQAGDFPAPVKYGYANVGVVEAGPASLVGRHVFTLYPHQTHFVVPAGAVHPVPDTVDPARAVLAANLETAVNGLWDAELKPGDRVAVIGGGAVGSLVAWLAGRTPGCEVTLVDVNAARADTAGALGVAFAADAAGLEADVVIHTSGAPAGLAAALTAAAMEARIVEMSWFGTQSVPLPLGEAFHAKRLSIVSSQVGHVAPSQRARWSYARRMGLALRLLADARLDVLITDESTFDDLPVTMTRLASTPGDTICHRIRY